MIIRLVNEKNLVKATEVKLIKTSDYQDTLTFKLPIDEEITVDELIGVRTKVMKQDYRVKEIITKDKYRDVYCEHKFFDCKNIIIPYVDEANRGTTSYNNFENYTNLQLIAGHLNRIMRTKGDTEYKFTTEVNRSGVIECDDTPLYDLIFGEKGILKTFNVELVYDNYRVKFVEKRPSKNTEILFHEKKNISELQATVDFKEIITKLHVTCKYTPETTEEQKEEKERARAAKRLETFNKSQERIRQREEKQAKERALKRKKEEEDYKANRKKPKRTKAQIHAEHVQRQQEREKKILASNETRRAERERKFNEREQQRAAQRVTKKKEKEKLILKTVYVSPLVNHYARPYEASLSFDSKEINSEEALIAWCNANIFTEEDPRDVPLSNFSFKPTLDNYNVDINDRAMVNFESIDTNKVIHCCKIEYDALHDKYISIEFGELNKSTMKEAIGNLNTKISEANSNISRGFNMIDSEIEAYVQKELEAYNELFDIEKEELEDNINQGIEDAKIEAEKVYGTINTDIEEKLAPIREEVRTTVEAYNQQFITTRQTLDRNKAEADRQIIELNKNKIETEKQFRELNQRITGMQDISSNSTVVELKKLVNEAKETGKNINQKVTELEGNVTREFSSVKAKNENDLKVIRGEIKTGVDGLSSKISSLEEYKNQDGSRTESLKQWVQRDTASQLSRERTEITRIVDTKGYVKNTEFSSKFNDNAQGINRKLEVLETYKNQDGTRTSALKQWTQENTASQLSTARRGIENWVDGKGYATTTIVENKVQETANSISREIRNIRESIPTSVGGRNYITDSEKLQSKPHWGSNKWDETVDGDTIILTKKGGSDNTGFWFNLTDLVKTQFQNETLTWSIDVKASRDMTLNTVGFETNGLRRVDISTQWKRMSHTFINKFTNYFAFVFYHPTNNFNNGDKIYIRLPKLEKGNVATDWTPAPEDNNAFVKNTEFSSKFNENAQGINRQLSALENYKNQDGARVANMQIWVQNNTANQLTAERRNIEKWVNDKGYATTSVVENKVQETANSFSREISNVREVIKDKVLSNDNLLLGTKDFIPKHFAPASPWQRALVWENEIERYNDFAVKSTIYQFNGLWQDVAVEKGKTYEYGFFVKGSRYTNKIVFSPGWASDNAKRPLAEYNIRNTEFTLTTNWKFHSFRFTVTSSGWSQCRVEKIEENNGIKLSICGLYLREVKNNETSPLGWKPAFEDEQLSINELNSWKQTTTQTLNTVSSSLNDTVRHSQLQITADSINFGSNKVFNGQNLASMLSVSPDSIKAITDRLVISPANENLVKPEYRRNSSFTKDMQISEEFDIGKTKDFLVKGKARTNSYENRFRFAIRIIYKDGTNDFVTGLESARYINGGEFSIPFKINEREKEIKNAYFTIDRYGTPTFDELSIVPQKSAELIVDGTIEGKHIKSSTIETGHLKAGSVTANIVAADAIESKHLKVSDAMIDKIVSNQAFVSKLWAKEAFINNLNSVKIKATQIDAYSLTGAIISGGILRGETKIQIGRYGYMVPAGNGLRFCLPRVNNANDGLGMQLLGNYGRLGDSPYGLYLYVDPDFDTRETKATDSYLMTVLGYINTRGVNNLKFTNYTDGSTAIGVWNKNVSLLFDSTDNDIFYQWKSKYSLWNIVNNYYNSTSDARLKKDIKRCDYKALDLIDGFNFKSFNWKYHEEFGQKPFTEIGLIAQDVEKINKNFVSMAGEYKTLNQFNLLTYSLKAIQELYTENKELKQRISKLEEKVNG